MTTSQTAEHRDDHCLRPGLAAAGRMQAGRPWTVLSRFRVGLPRRLARPNHL